MKLKRNGWIMTLAYWGDFSPWKETANLCNVFWRFILSLFVIVGLTGLAVYLAYMAYLYPWDAFRVVAIILGLALAVTIMCGIEYFFSQKSITGAYIKAKKEKWCPVVEIED